MYLRILYLRSDTYVGNHFNYTPIGINLTITKHMTKQVAHPMTKLQRKVSSLVDSKIVKPEDNLGKIAFILGKDWQYWKKELIDFDFSLKDPIQELLLVEDWDEN